MLMGIRSLTIALFAMNVLLAIPATAQKKDLLQIFVYVDAAPQAVSADGFVDSSDKWLQDSVADLKKALNNKNFHPNKGFPGSPAHYTVINDPAKADVVLTVAARGTSAESLGQRTTMQFYRGVVMADTVPTVGVTRWVSVVLSVGNYRREIVTWYTNQSRFSAGAWTKDAKRHALEVAGWVMANEAKIKERQAALK